MKLRLLLFAFLIDVCALFAQPFPEHAGQDAVYNFDVPALTAAPQGYTPAFIEHYGRHGSRYAYNSDFYTNLMDALLKADKAGALTERGRQLLADYSSHYEHYLQNVGNLSEIGWRQQQEIARTMVSSFPEAFSGADAYAYASSSASTRAMMSMSGFCSGLQGAAPQLDVFSEQGLKTLNASNPRDSNNPDYVPRAENRWPFAEHLDGFSKRKFNCRPVLERLFTDVDSIIGADQANDFTRRFYILAVGMNSLLEEDRTDFSGIFTENDLKQLFEVQNFQAAEEWWPYEPRCAAVTLDIIGDADRRLAEGRGGVTARFGHDHVILPVLRMMGVNYFAGEPTTTDKVIDIFNVKDSPMAANIQLVFYKADNGAPVLVKMLLNGVEASLGIPAAEGPYYRWDDVRAYFETRLARFPEFIPYNTRAPKSTNKDFVTKVAYYMYEDANACSPEADVIFIGDSITQNWYSFHPGFFDNNGFLARGISGQTSISVLCRFQQDVIKHNPKVVVMMIGTNDVAQNDGAISNESYLDNIASICTLAKANGIKMLLCTIPPCDAFRWNKSVTPAPRIAELNGKLKAYADANKIQFVDYYSVLDNGKGGLIEDYTYDHCHPLPKGYCAMERVIAKELKKALGKKTDFYVTPE